MASPQPTRHQCPKPSADNAATASTQPAGKSTKTPGNNGVAGSPEGEQGDLPLPHERDQQSSHMTGGVPSGRVRQAAHDVERGLQDTSKATEMDRAYKQQQR